jgi:serine/threonine protein phosphatase PrpC
MTLGKRGSIVRPMMSCSVGGMTDVGCLRELNEDAWYAGAGVYFVTDGMGGHAAGDVASRIGVEVLSELVGADVPDHPEAGSIGQIDRLVAEANRRMLAHATRSPESVGLGCTIAGICHVRNAVGATEGGLDGDAWAVFHLGDSRVYDIVGGHLRRLTRDHSEVQELVDAGVITSEQARVHPSRNIITRALGETPPATAEVSLVGAVAGQRLLICSDGLTTEVPEERIAATLRHVQDAQSAATALVQLALDGGGRDNVTAVVVDVLSVAGGATPGNATIPRELIERENVS